jgi:hypothetical protein
MRSATITLAIAAGLIATAAHAAVVTVTYDTLATTARNDFLSFEPSFSNALGPNGLPVASNAYDFSDVLNAHQLAWWTDGTPLASPPTPLIVTNPEDISVNPHFSDCGRIADWLTGMCAASV